MLFKKVKKVKSRLVKKAELFNTIQNTSRNEKYIEFFKNPTYAEWKSCITDKAQYGFNVAIRAMLLEDGTVYCWPGTILHDTAVQKYNIPDGIHLEINNQNYFDIYQDDSEPFEYVYNAFKNTKSLYNYVNHNATIEWVCSQKCIFPGIDEQNKEDVTVKKISDIFNIYEKINNVTATNKKHKKGN